jgi:hypothetical protein
MNYHKNKVNTIGIGNNYVNAYENDLIQYHDIELDIDTELLNLDDIDDIEDEDEI